jgi:hypothetical protein
MADSGTADSKRPTQSHSAAGPALGYIHQFEVALVDFVPYALRSENVTISLEVFDDVSFRFGDGPAREVIQVHHSVDSQRELIDTSAKLWKTLAIWVKEWRQLEGDESRLMTFLTTQRARSGSGLAALASGSYDLDYALRELVKIAEDTSGAVGTEEARAAFVELGGLEQRRLLRNVRVIDATPQATSNRARLEAALQPAHRSEYIPSMADGVEGRWWPRVVTALAQGGEVHADALRADIDEVRDSLSKTSLPVLRLEDFTADDLPEVNPDGAEFLRCLDAVAVSPARRTMAIDDYRRAFAHRSRWGRRGLLGPNEFGAYEDKLFREWLIASDRMLRTMDEHADAQKRKSIGHDLWDDVEQSVMTPLRRDITEPFVQRGSFHQLAEQQRVAWHPDAAAPLHTAAGADEEDEAA